MFIQHLNSPDLWGGNRLGAQGGNTWPLTSGPLRHRARRAAP